MQETAAIFCCHEKLLWRQGGGTAPFRGYEDYFFTMASVAIYGGTHYSE